MGLAALCVRRPVFATMLIMVLVVLGIAAFSQLGIDLYPKMDFPMVTVSAVLPGASAEEVETEVTKPIEEVVNTIQGIDELRATTSEGYCTIMVQFKMDQKIEQVAQDVRDKVATITRLLPEGMDPPVIQKMDPDSAPIISISVSSDRSLREITEIADKQIKQQIEGLSGIGQVLLVGGLDRAMQIEIDAAKLNSFGLSIGQVSATLQRENVEIPGGRIDQDKRELVLRTLGRISTAEQFGDLIVSMKNDVPVRIRDFAKVTDSWEEPRGLARLDGKSSVSLMVRKQSGTNTVQTIETVKAALVIISKMLPPDIKVSVIRDQSAFIQGSVNAIYEHLLLGGLLASVVVFFFMRNLRATLIAAVAIPISIISSFSFMYLLGYTLNNMTLLGLTVSVGIVIDDAIVVLENIFRFIEEKHYTPMDAAVEATKEIGLAVMATTLSLVVIFAPVIFLGGITGQFLQCFGLTAAAAIIVSLLVSFTLTPMLSSRFIRMKDVEKSSATEHGSSKESKIYRWIEDTYIRALEWSMGHRKTIVLICTLVFLTTFPLLTRIGKDFIPQDDQDEFEVYVRTPEGSSLQNTDEVLRKMEARIKALPEILHLLTTVNSSGTGGVTGGNIYVRLTPLETRKISQFDIMKQVRAEIQDFPGVRTSVSSLSPVGGSTGSRQSPVTLLLRGPDLEQLGRLSNTMLDKMQNVPGLVDVDSSMIVGNPEIQVRILRDKASDLGVTVMDIASTLRLMISGEQEITKFKDGDELYEVRLRLKPEQRKNAESIAGLMVPTSRGGLVRLDNVALIERGTGPAQISRYNRQHQVTLTANTLPGKSLSEAMADMEKLVAETGLPAGYNYIFTGQGKIFAELISSFLVAISLALVFVYMVLASQFESFIHPISIMASLPLAVPFAIISLFIANKTLHIFSALGLLLLFGIVKKNSILQVDFTNRLRREHGYERYKAIIEANRARLRPILMTTISIIAGMIPTALARGAGSGSRGAIAVVIIGGQSLCFLLTLLAIPVVYSIIDDLGKVRWFGWVRSLRPATPTTNGVR